MTYDGQSLAHTIQLLEAVDSEFFRLVFDTGNPVFSDLRRGGPPYRKQDSWDFCKQIKPFIGYLHIMGGRHLADGDGYFPEVTYTYPGDGDARIPEIITDLLRRGYDSGFSIEPHMEPVVHDAAQDASAFYRFDTYVEYGRRCMQQIEAARQRVLAGLP